jgi:anti-sigma regulatory factor (Ser/Thr protein kinase)
MAALPEPVRLDSVFPAQPPFVPEIRRAVSDVAIGSGANEHALVHINLAVSEAATNVVLHAYRDRDEAGRVRVTAEPDDGWLDVSVCDCGIGMAPRHDSPGLGLGLGLICHEADVCEIRALPEGGTEVSLRFALRPRHL